MALKGQAKTDYQREYMREYMRNKRANVKTPLRPVKTQDVKTLLKTVGLTLEDNKIVGVTKGVKPPLVPIYNQAIHRTGDRVKVFDGNKMVEMVVPELDADDSPIPDRAMSQSYSLISNKTFIPTFRPVAKPSPKVKTRGKKWY